MTGSNAVATAPHDNGFFTKTLAESDPELYRAVVDELNWQQQEIELIASENIVSRAVLEAAGSVLTNKYAEGYPGKALLRRLPICRRRENLAIDRAKRLFDCGFANVQPHSGAQANQARVPGARCSPATPSSGMSLACGRPSHPWRARRTCPANGSRPCNMACGATIAASISTRSRRWRASTSRASSSPAAPPIRASSTSPRFREIADSVGAYLHGRHGAFRRAGRRRVHPSPLPHAHVVTTTTHKTLARPARRHDPHQ